MSIFELWLFTTAIPGVASLANLFVLILSLGEGGLLIYSGINFSLSNNCPELNCSKEERRRADSGFSVARKFVPYLIIAAILSSVLPSERQMLLIAGGFTATNNAEIKKLPTNAAKAVNAWLDAVSEENGEQTKKPKN